MKSNELYSKWKSRIINKLVLFIIFSIIKDFLILKSAKINSIDTFMLIFTHVKVIVQKWKFAVKKSNNKRRYTLLRHCKMHKKISCKKYNHATNNTANWCFKKCRIAVSCNETSRLNTIWCKTKQNKTYKQTKIATVVLRQTTWS